MKRITIISMIAVGLAMASIGGSSTAIAKSAYLKPYILGKGHGFEIYSNSKWRAEGTGPAKQLEHKDPGAYGSKDPSFRIWTRNCKPGQKVTFTRNVDLLGRPRTDSVSLSLDFSHAVESYDVFFNNTKVAHNTPTLKRRNENALHRGGNDIDVAVKLRNIPNACAFVSEPSQRGMYLKLGGTFESDLRAPKGEDGIFVTSPGDSRGKITIGVRADGSTVIPEAALTLQISGTLCIEYLRGKCVDYMFALVTQSGSMVCKNADGFILVSNCTVSDAEPGRVRTATAGIVFHPDSRKPDWVEEYTVLSWSARISQLGPWETNSNNNSGQVKLVFCHYGAASDACNPKPAT